MLRLVLFTVICLFIAIKNKWAELRVCVGLLFTISLNFNVTKTSLFIPIIGVNCDIIRLSLFVLRVWITILIILSSTSINRHLFKPKWFLVLVIVLLGLLIITFTVSNIFMFYLAFESTLIPTLILIMGWGYQPERVQAGIYILFYTLAASLPLLVIILYIKNNVGTISIPLIRLTSIKINQWGYIACVLAFLVKIPIFFVHLWLPKAHVEAPVRGSIILAGILLKLGGYGLIRLGYIFQNSFSKLNIMWISIRLVGGSLVSLICIRQTDTKCLVAYSSVAHIRLVISGAIIQSSSSILGVLVIIIAHGLCSSGIFCLTNILYERTSSRNIIICKGFINIMPSIALWWFVISICNMSAPPSINLLSEILLINRICGWNLSSIIPLIFMSFMSAAFTLYLFAFTQHGSYPNNIYSVSPGHANEYLSLFLHWLPINLIIVKSTLLVIYFNSL